MKIISTRRLKMNDNNFTFTKIIFIIIKTIQIFILIIKLTI